MSMRFHLLPLLTLVALCACAAHADDARRTLQWVGQGANKNFSTLGNFLDVAGQTNAVPRSGDILKILTNTSSAKNDIAGLAPYLLRLENYQTQNAASLPLVFTTNAETCAGIDNAGFLHYDFPTALLGTNVPVNSSSTLVGRSRFFSLDGQPCGIRKTGSGTVGLNGSQIYLNPAFTGPAYAGFKYVDIAQGTFAFGLNGGQNSLFPADMVVTFSGAGTMLMLRGTCAFTNFWLRETGAAVGAAHQIGAQKDGYERDAHLKICGTVPEDVTAFTGTIVGCVDFTWAPDAATQSFVFDGGVSTTTGRLAVANGTVRLKNGASFTQLRELTLSGGADTTLAVEAAPSKTFHAARGELLTGEESLALASGVTLRFGGLVVNGARIAAGTYTASNASWITGAGSVVVEGLIAFTYTWAKKTTYANLKWSTADNWVDQYNQNGVPQNGDTIYLPGRDIYNAGGQEGRTDGNKNDLADFHPRRIYIQSGYSCPSGNAVTFDGTDPSDGLYNDFGYMYYSVPIHVNADAITLYSNRGIGYRTDLCSTDGHRFRVTKTGDGTFGLCDQNTKYDLTGLTYLDIAAGIFSFGWQGRSAGAYYPAGLQIRYTGLNTSLAVSQNTTLRDAVITETAAVAGQAHYLRREAESKQDVTLTLTGVPAAEEQTFTGRLLDPLSLAWAPEADDRTFTFSSSNSVNTTTKTLSVTNGTLRLAAGATFTQLGTLALSGGAGTAFRVDGLPAQPFFVTNLVLATGLETLAVRSGVKVACETLTVNGAALAAGVYHSALCAGAGTGVAWMDGAGYLCVGGADVTFPAEPSGETVAVSWTANGGADTSVGNAANWGEADNATLPDFASGTLAATFAAGTGAALDRTARFRALALDAPGAFAFTAPDAACYATLGAGGLATSGAGRTYSLAWPIYLLGNQTWTVGAGDTLALDGLLGGTAERLVFPGGGTVNANRTQGYSGALVFSNGVVNANADDCFGAHPDVPVDVHMYTAKLYLNGVTLHRTIRNITADVQNDKLEGSKKGYLYVKAGTTNVIDGDLNLEAYTDMHISLGAESSLRVKGHFRRGRSYWCTLASDAEKGADVYFEKKVKVLAGAAMATAGQIRYHFLAADNDFGSNWFAINGTKMQLHTYVPYAFTATGNHRLHADADNADRIFDLHGHDQGLTEFFAPFASLTVRSDAAATLHLNVTSQNYIHTNACLFAGGAGLSFEGTKMAGLSGVSATTGTVQVTQGELRFTPAGAWPNASAAVVAGGTLSVNASGTFGTNTVLRLSSAGKLNLGAGVRLKVAVPPELDGEPLVRMGTYGSSQSNAKYRDDDHFAGTGVVQYGLQWGLGLIIR